MIGKMVSHYRVMATLGKGGMGIVYKAQDTRLGRFVALKFLLEEFCGSREFLEQFLQEARTASALNHPAICTIHDIDQYRDRPFIVMEWLQGETLRDKLRRTGFRVEEAIKCAIHIADALCQAHALGIVHRDISPANLFLTSDGRVKLLDFGIAKLSAGHDNQLRTADQKANPITGTIHYMSPEQALGQEVDRRSDIFSVGVLLYQMLTGRLPFTGRTIGAVINQIVTATPESVRTLAPRVPLAIEKVVDTCLQKYPERRYQAAEDLRVNLKLATATIALDKMKYVTSAPESALDDTERTVLSENPRPGQLYELSASSGETISL